MTYDTQPPSPTPPRSKRSKLSWILGTAGVVVMLCCASGIFMANRLDRPGGTASGGSSASMARLGQPVRDGKFEFTVTNVVCGKPSEGTGLTTRTARGEYCEVAVTVKNIGTVPQVFDGSSQKAKGPAGATYADDRTAELYANNSDQAFLSEINPGNAVPGVLVFDVPRGGRIPGVELHDSVFSTGVTVSV
jgi:hypothetical protein